MSAPISNADVTCFMEAVSDGNTALVVAMITDDVRLRMYLPRTKRIFLSGTNDRKDKIPEAMTERSRVAHDGEGARTRTQRIVGMLAAATAGTPEDERVAEVDKLFAEFCRAVERARGAAEPKTAIGERQASNTADPAQ